MGSWFLEQLLLLLAGAKRSARRRLLQALSVKVDLILLFRESAVVVREPKLKVDLTKYVEELES